MDNWLVWSLLSALFADATAVLAKIGVTGVDESNQFSQLEIWKPRPGSSIRIGGWTWFRSRKRFGLNRSGSMKKRASKCK